MPAQGALNPDASPFGSPQRDQGRLNPQASPFKRSAKPFQWNPKAAPWIPTSFQAPTASSKPVVLIVGPPGVGKSSVGEALAKHFGGRFWSAAAALRKTKEEDAKRPFGTQGRHGVLWHDTLDALKDLDAVLTAAKDDASVKGFVLDAQGRNTQQFFYLCSVLQNHRLYPGQVLDLDNADDDQLLRQCKAAAKGDWAGEDDARRRIQTFRLHHRQRRAVLKQAKGLVHIVDATQDTAKVIEDAKKVVQLIFERPLGYKLPHTAEATCLHPIENVYEYNHVAQWIADKVSGGEARWPCSQAAGHLAMVGGKIVNTRAPKDDPSGEAPSSKTHMVSKKPDGTRFLLVYLPQLQDPSQGRYYIVPKHMEVVYTFRPHVAGQDFDIGGAPQFAGTGAKAGLWSFAADGDLVKLSSGWGGLQGSGCEQWKFIVNDMLYYEPERPRELLARHAQWSLDRRLQCIRRLGWPDEASAPTKVNTVSLCTKIYYTLDHLEELVRSVDHQEDAHKVTGLVFTPVRKYLLWRDPQLIVWNHNNYHTVLLTAKDTGKKDGQSHMLALFERGGTQVGETAVADAEAAAAADGHVCQVRAVWDNQVGGNHSWELVHVRGDLPAGVDTEGLKAYLDPSTWITGKAIYKQLSKVTMQPAPEDDRPVGEKPRMRPAGGSPRYGGYGR
eukprot:TRINITY_DN75_c0_g1_i2.p1 TRINITY_DN75_c0_g1~~TRINITY_DN75_c0_g1_i2.p1  ORF type:complete len:669 (+),score=188.78 TRINITY_DN75_c0_g1_i2:84-2090(+)